MKSQLLTASPAAAFNIRLLDGGCVNIPKSQVKAENDLLFVCQRISGQRASRPVYADGYVVVHRASGLRLASFDSIDMAIQVLFKVSLLCGWRMPPTAEFCRQVDVIVGNHGGLLYTANFWAALGVG